MEHSSHSEEEYDPFLVEAHSERMSQIKAEGDEHNNSLTHRLSDFEEKIISELKPLQYRVDEIAVFLFEIKRNLEKAMTIGKYLLWGAAIAAIGDTIRRHYQ